jgi:nucleoside-diphosphate-sugar epimerase
MKNILITGGAGFIGSHLSERLRKEGHNITLVDKFPDQKDSNPFIEADLVSLEASRKLTSGFDVVIHLASLVKIDEMLKNPKESIKNNVDATLNLLEDIRLNNPKCLLIFASSDKVYGKANKRKVNENECCIPMDPYGCSKLMCESLIEAYHATYDINYIILRSGNVFGPRQNPGLFIPSVIDKISKGQDTITTGKLDSKRNFVYIADLAEAYARCINTKEAENNIFNIMSYNKKMSEVTDEIATAAKNKLGRNIIFKIEEKISRKASIESNHFIMDCAKAEKILGWKPSVSFSEAISKTFNYCMQKQGDAK